MTNSGWTNKMDRHTEITACVPRLNILCLTYSIMKSIFIFLPYLLSIKTSRSPDLYNVGHITQISCLDNKNKTKIHDFRTDDFSFFSFCNRLDLFLLIEKHISRHRLNNLRTIGSLRWTL